jgi:hypothetical protein
MVNIILPSAMLIQNDRLTVGEVTLLLAAPPYPVEPVTEVMVKAAYDKITYPHLPEITVWCLPCEIAGYVNLVDGKPQEFRLPAGHFVGALFVEGGNIFLPAIWPVEGNPQSITECMLTHEIGHVIEATKMNPTLWQGYRTMRGIEENIQRESFAADFAQLFSTNPTSWNGYKRLDNPEEVKRFILALTGATPEPQPKPGDKIVLWLGKTAGRQNGQEFIMENAPYVVNGRTMVSLRFIAERLGCTVTYHEADQSIEITRKA